MSLDPKPPVEDIERKLREEAAKWGANAIFTREELEALISDIRILEDRRVLYGLKGLAALRHSEASGLTWRQYEDNLRPLGAINM